MTNFSRFLSTKRTVLLWAAAVVVAVGGGTAAVAASGPDPDVLTQNDVRNQLDDSSSSAPAASPSASGSSAAPSPGAGDRMTRQTKGGWVAFRCSGRSVYLESWSPKPGYRADHVQRGPAERVSVEFESDTANDVTVVVACNPPAEPSVTVSEEYDDHGGDRNGDDSSGHGGDDKGGDQKGDDGGRGRDHPEDD